MYPATFRGLTMKIAPHTDIRKLGEVVCFLYDTHKSIYQQKTLAIAKKKDGVDDGTGRDILSVLSECNLPSDYGLLHTLG